MFRISLDLNKELLQSTHKWIIPDAELKNNEENLQLALTANKNLQTLGFTLSVSAIHQLAALNHDELVQQYYQLFLACKELTGADVIPDSVIFYPDFPNQVLEMDELEHYMNQIIHYIGIYQFGETILPETELTERTALLEGFERKPVIIELGVNTDVFELMRNRMFSNHTLSKSKMDSVALFMNESKEWVKWIATTAIPNKENRIAIASVIKNDTAIPEHIKFEQLSDVLKDSVDVLRFAAYLSNGKTRTQKIKQRVYVWNENNPQNKHLEWRTKRIKTVIDNNDIVGKVFFKLNHAEERLIKRLLASRDDLFTAVWLRPDLFKSLANNISMNDTHLPRLSKAFDNLFHNIREDELRNPIKSPYAIINEAIDALKNKEQDAFLQLENAVSLFPGIFSRNFFHAVDVCHNKAEIQTICDIYGKHCQKVPVRELLKVYNLVDVQTPERVIFMAKQNKYISVPLSETRNFTCETKEMIKDAVFHAIMNQLPKLNKSIYVDDKSACILLPENGERDASKGHVLTSGSSYESNPNCNIIRQFIWWTNAENNRPVDIDTGVIFFDADMNYITDCFYSHPKAKKDDIIIAVHSGDIINGGNINGPGVMEAIDIDKTLARSIGAKYAVLSMTSYSGQPYCKLPNVKYGIMEREGTLNIQDIEKHHPEMFDGKIFEPTTVEFCIDVNTNATQSVPVIYDIEAERFIWIDKPIDRFRAGLHVRTNESLETMVPVMKRFGPNTNPTPSVGDLFAAYAAVSGTLVTNPADADIIIAFNKDSYADMTLKDNVDIISVFDMDRISAEFMCPANLLPDINQTAVVTNECQYDFCNEEFTDIEY